MILTLQTMFKWPTIYFFLLLLFNVLTLITSRAHVLDRLTCHLPVHVNAQWTLMSQPTKHKFYNYQLSTMTNLRPPTNSIVALLPSRFIISNQNHFPFSSLRRSHSVVAPPPPLWNFYLIYVSDFCWCLLVLLLLTLIIEICFAYEVFVKMIKSSSESNI